MSEGNSESAGARGPTSDEYPTIGRSDRILQRSIEKRWPVKTQYKQAVVDQMALIVLDRTSTKRAKTSAARVLLTAESQNQADEHKQQPELIEHSHSVQVYLPHNGRDSVVETTPVSDVLNLPLIEESPTAYDDD